MNTVTVLLNTRQRGQAGRERTESQGNHLSHQQRHWQVGEV